MTTSNDNRRRFDRMEMTESAIAVDELGFQLGRVSEASGGGMQVEAASPEALKKMPMGAKLHISIVEPVSDTCNTMHVEVRYISGTTVGMEFV